MALFAKRKTQSTAAKRTRLDGPEAKKPRVEPIGGAEAAEDKAAAETKQTPDVPSEKSTNAEKPEIKKTTYISEHDSKSDSKPDSKPDKLSQPDQIKADQFGPSPPKSETKPGSPPNDISKPSTVVLSGSHNIRASHSTDYQKDVCTQFLKTGRCRYGDECKFLHERDDAAVLKPNAAVDAWQRVKHKHNKRVGRRT